MKNKNTNNTTLVQRAGRAAGTGLMKLGQFIQKHSGTLACCLMVCLMIGKVVCATTTTGDKADDMWLTLTDLVAKWVTRLGGVVIFVGGIMFALGWKSDDADQKSRGIQTMIAGAMVAAIAGITGTFFT